MLLASLVILGAVIGYGYGIARQILEQELEAKAWQLSRAVTARIESVEVAVRKTVDGMGGRMAIDAPRQQAAGVKDDADRLAGPRCIKRNETLC